MKRRVGELKSFELPVTNQPLARLMLLELTVTKLLSKYPRPSLANKVVDSSYRVLCSTFSPNVLRNSLASTWRRGSIERVVGSSGEFVRLWAVAARLERNLWEYLQEGKYLSRSIRAQGAGIKVFASCGSVGVAFSWAVCRYPTNF
jgi:hypothetical protein